MLMELPAQVLSHCHNRKSIALQALSTLSSTTKQDAAQLAAIEATGNDSADAQCMRLSIQYGMQHKQGLARAYKLADACLQVLGAGGG